MSQTQGTYTVESQGNKIHDESNDKKYFIITPRIVKAYSRNPYDLALWDTIKDIAGESGECYLNTEQLAILSGMSAGKASESRKYWIELGFLKGEIRQDPGYPQPVWHITVPDLWKINIEWCENNPKIQDRVNFMLSQKSLHQVKPSPDEERPSPHETKNNQQQEELNIYTAEDFQNMSIIQAQKVATLKMYKKAAGFFPGFRIWFFVHDFIVKNKLTFESIESAAVNWESCGFKPENVKGILEWARDGVPSNLNGKKQGQKRTETPVNESKVVSGTKAFLQRHAGEGA